jgi:hypothetical protein
MAGNTELMRKAQKARWKHIEDWPSGQRLCYTCGTMKLFEEFGKNVNTALGYDSVCRACRQVKSKRDYARSSQEYRIWYRAKRRAKVESLPFDIEVSDIVIPAVCPVLGKPFVIGDPDWTPSLDKVIPELGYVKGNVYVISNRANRLKNDATLAELQEIVSYIQWPSLKLPPINLYTMPKLA